MFDIGPVELAAVGVSIAVFNQASRIAIFPLVSVTTSFVAEEDTITKVSPEPPDTESKDIQSQDVEGLDTESQSNSENKELIPQNSMLEIHVFIILLYCPSSFRSMIMILSPTLSIDSAGSVYKSETTATSFEVVKPKPEKRHIPSASSALIIGAILGLIQAVFLISGAKPILNFMGVKYVSKVLNKVAKDTKFSQVKCKIFNPLAIIIFWRFFTYICTFRVANTSFS